VDAMTRTLAQYATSLDYDDLPPEVVHEIKRLLLDALGCGIGGFHTPTGKLARAVAGRVSTDYLAAHILGTRTRSTPDLAGFANSSMVRALDFNDMVPGGHPSDALGAIVAVADALHAPGRDLIPAAVVSYEIFTALVAAVKTQKIGWDQGYFISLATTCGTARLLGLSFEQAAHAVAISATAHLSTRHSRAGELSMWKGVAAPYAARDAILATLLAAEGMTGPEQPFEGRDGAFERVTGPFELRPLGAAGKPFGLFDVRMKYWPVEGNTQVGVWLARELREWAPVEQIESIDVETYWACWSEVGSEPAKWDPQTRETADHSLPYIMAVVLRSGEITLDAFRPRTYLDPSLRPIMNKITVRESPELSALWPENFPMRVTATRKDGERRILRLDNPRGHRSNPMTDQDIEDKFSRLCESVLSGQQIEAVIGDCWSLERQPDSADLLAKLVL
jgi:2-methylcitrate dehydratase